MNLFRAYMRDPDPWQWTWKGWDWFESWYCVFGLLTVLMMRQYAALYYLDRKFKYARFWFALPAAVFIVENFLYQTIVATIMFWERPRHLQLTQRIQWMVDRGDERAYRFRRFLNMHDNKHIDLPDDAI